MDVTQEVLRMLDEVLSLNGRAALFTAASPLLGNVPELDSMGVVSVIASLEDHFGFMIDDDEIDGNTFATLGSLVSFVNSKLAAA